MDGGEDALALLARFGVSSGRAGPVCRIIHATQTRQTSRPQLSQRCALVHRDVVRFVALDFVLRIIGAGMVGVSLVVCIFRVNLDDRAADMTSFRVPSHMVANLEFRGQNESSNWLRDLGSDLWSLSCGRCRLELDFSSQTLEIAMDDGHGQLLAAATIGDRAVARTGVE